MRKRLSWVVAALAVLLGVGQARADIIYSNLGPGDTYRQNSSWQEIGPDAGIPERRAFSFTVTGGNFFFDSAELGLSLFSGTNAIDLRLYSDAGGQPGTVLETIHATDLPPFNSTDNTLTTFTSALHPLLQAGGTYWLLPFASGDTYAMWNINNTGANGTEAYSFQGEPTAWGTETDDELGAFRVNGTPADGGVRQAMPEPASLTLLGVGGLCLLGYGRWRRAAA